MVLAGDREKGCLKNCSGVDCEALIPIGNRVMVDYVVSALRETGMIERIALVGPVEQLKKYYHEEKDIFCTDSGETVLRSMEKGIQCLNPEGKVLVATADIPLITAGAVKEFIRLCELQGEADLYYTVILKELNEKKYPGVKRTYVHLKEGVFTGGNLFLVNPEIVSPCLAKGEQLVRLRKSPFALSRKIGVVFILKYLLHVLSLEEAEKRFSDLLGIKGSVVIIPYPEVGIDVDKPSDLELVRRVLGA